MIKPDLPAFRPDFIIKFIDGRIGVFDTKGINYMVEDTKNKAEALQVYINEKRRRVKFIWWDHSWTWKWILFKREWGICWFFGW